MSIVVIGINHRTGPLALLERVSVSTEALPKVIASLTSRVNIREAVVLSTCNRTEVYAVAERFHGAYADIRDFFCEQSGLQPDDLHPHLYSQHDEAAVEHLFAVAAGLESAVIGETEILGQVRSAWELAQAEGGARAALNLLFRHAIETGKRARTETAISRGTASVSHAAVEMATERLSSLQGRHVFVVGAGEMGEGVAAALVGAGAANITVANRTRERAEELARRFDGRIIALGDLRSELHAADVLVTCTGAGTTVIDAKMVRTARAGVTNPLLIVDIAVPRDVAGDVADLDGVTLLDLDDLRDWAAKGLEKRQAETESVKAIVGEEVERYASDVAARQAAPLVAQLREHAENIRAAEIARFASRLSGLDPAQVDAVEALTKGIIAKLLHAPSVHLKENTGTPGGDRNAAAVRDLFDLS